MRTAIGSEAGTIGSNRAKPYHSLCLEKGLVAHGELHCAPHNELGLPPPVDLEHLDVLDLCISHWQTGEPGAQRLLSRDHISEPLVSNFPALGERAYSDSQISRQGGTRFVGCRRGKQTQT